MAQAPSRKVYGNPDYVYFWYPHTATFDTADVSLKFKPPEIANTFDIGRNQSIVRTAGSKTLVYDRGTNFNTKMSLNFKYVTDGMRSQLIVFLEAIQWASRIAAYMDTYGDIYYVRLIEERGITLVDQGLQMKADQKKTPSIIQWDLTLDLLNLTDNPEELEDPEPPLSSALWLHIHDYDDPHAPKTTVTVQVSEGYKTIEAFFTNQWQTIIWIVIATKGAKECTWIVNGAHDRNGATPAANTDLVTEQLSAIGDTPSKIGFQLALAGSGAAQKMSLQVGTTEDGYTVSVRRIKL